MSAIDSEPEPHFLTKANELFDNGKYVEAYLQADDDFKRQVLDRYDDDTGLDARQNNPLNIALKDFFKACYDIMTPADMQRLLAIKEERRKNTIT